MSSEFEDERKMNGEADAAVDAPERRDFLKKAGKFAVVTPAAVTALLSTSMDANATGIFKSGGGYAGPKKKIKRRVYIRRKVFKKRLKKRWKSFR